MPRSPSSCGSRVFMALNAEFLHAHRPRHDKMQFSAEFLISPAGVRSALVTIEEEIPESVGLLAGFELVGVVHDVCLS